MTFLKIPYYIILLTLLIPFLLEEKALLAQGKTGLSFQYGVNLNEPTPISDIVKGYKYPVVSPEFGIQFDFKRIALSYTKNIFYAPQANYNVIADVTGSSSNIADSIQTSYSDNDEFYLFYKLEKTDLIEFGLGYKIHRNYRQYIKCVKVSQVQIPC